LTNFLPNVILFALLFHKENNMSSFQNDDVSPAKAIKSGSVAAFREMLLMNGKTPLVVGYSFKCEPNAWFATFERCDDKSSLALLIIMWMWCKEREYLSEEENVFAWQSRYIAGNLGYIVCPESNPSHEAAKLALQFTKRHVELREKLPEDVAGNFIAAYLIPEFFEIEPNVLAEILDDCPEALEHRNAIIQRLLYPMAPVLPPSLAN
jgi:hypothetical protein